ncbi:hypothetical protein RRG08_009777 [Elysia crispata]|uniref:Uncharacterized protein n=1 Tax=Elysia crispata TaxID=231223 RepID=A0AAE0ZQZ1_9GAST|nr:hypothetical protein RRG08_009777 [Elysia crispata]
MPGQSRDNIPQGKSSGRAQIVLSGRHPSPLQAQRESPNQVSCREPRAHRVVKMESEWEGTEWDGRGNIKACRRFGMIMDETREIVCDKNAAFIKGLSCIRFMSGFTCFVCSRIEEEVFNHQGADESWASTKRESLAFNKY